MSVSDAAQPVADASTSPDASIAEDATPANYIPEYMQRDGDPVEGYRALVNDDYVGCGLPYSVYELTGAVAPPELRLPGRMGRNETLEYDFNAFTTSDGVDVVANNCLTCHAELVGDQVIVGLGAANRDFTFDPGPAAQVAGMFVNTPKEREEWMKWSERISTTGPYIQAPVIGANPADNLALILFAHRDPMTLAWSHTPLLDPPPAISVPVDVPPWWRMKKKHAMFYHGGGRGDHARIMMTASVLCVDSVNHAGYIDSFFPNVRAYIYSIVPPAYPEAIDQMMADRGKSIFEATCSRCHGTYGESGSYPNLLIPLDEIGTDPVLARGAVDETQRFRDWFAASFYGEIAQLEPSLGYVAPPLDGIWLTGPFLHNGSVPSIEALLDSSKRPQYFSRTYVAQDYVPSIMSWRFSVLDHGQAAEPNQNMKKRIYDTTLLGMGNGGHTFGDVLSAEERHEVIEYLKTL